MNVYCVLGYGPFRGTSWTRRSQFNRRIRGGIIRVTIGNAGRTMAPGHFEGSLMKHSSGPRKTASNLSESTHRQLDMYALAASAAGVSELSTSTHHRLSMYALAASAAGVSLLALSQPSEAKIVYTRANIGLGSVVRLDLNHDGIYDFYLVAQINTGKSSNWGVFPAQAGNLVVGTKGQASGSGPKPNFRRTPTSWRRCGGSRTPAPSTARVSGETSRTAISA